MKRFNAQGGLMVFCKRCGAYSARKTKQCSNCQSHFGRFGRETTPEAWSLLPSILRTARTVFRGVLSMTLATTLLWILVPYLQPRNSLPVRAFLETLAVLMYVASFLAGVILLVVMKRWKTPGAGFLSLCAFAAILPQLLRTCGCGPPESAAVSNLRTINTAQVIYLTGHNSYASIEDLIKEGL